MNNTQISKFLSLVLRHKPQEINLQLDENGWADTDELIAKSTAHGIALNFDLLEEIVFTNDKKRFSFKDDLSKIRANQGHSVAIDLALTATVPPEKLYHGTVAQFMEVIKVNGLQKMSRQHVHLSTNIDTAKKVGARRGKPVILTVNTIAMQQQGFLFYIADNGVWLTDNVHVAFIEF